MTEVYLKIKVDASDVNAAKKSLGDLAGDGKNTQTSMNQFGAAVKTAMRVVATALGANEIKNFADDWKEATNRLKVVTKADIGDVSKKLVDLANDTSTSFKTTTNLFSTLTQSTKTLGLDQTKLLNLTRSINTAFVISGSSAGSAAGAITQLSQAFASGYLRGDEFNSVAEQAPVIMDAIATKTGASRGELRKLAEEGKLDIGIVLGAIQDASAGWETSLNSMERTFGQSLVVAKNNLTEFIGSNNAVKASVTGVGDAMVGMTAFLRTDFADYLGFVSPEFETFVNNLADGADVIKEALAAAFDIDLAGSDLGGIAEWTSTRMSEITTFLQIAGVEVQAHIDAQKARFNLFGEDESKALAVIEQARVDTIANLMEVHNQDIKGITERREKWKMERADRQEDIDSTGTLIGEVQRLNTESQTTWSGIKGAQGEIGTALGGTSDKLAEYAFDWSYYYDGISNGTKFIVTETKTNLLATEGEWATYYTKLDEKRIKHQEAEALAAEADKKRIADLAEEAKKKADEQKRARDALVTELRGDISSAFANMMMEGDNAFDAIAKSFERMILKMLADLATSKLFDLIGNIFNIESMKTGGANNPVSVLGGIISEVMGGGGGGGGSGASGVVGSAATTAAAGAVQGAISGTGAVSGATSALSGSPTGTIVGGIGAGLAGAGSVLGTSGAVISAAEYGMLTGGATVGAGGSIGAGMAAGLKGLGTGAMNLLQAIPGWGWALGGLAVAAALLDKDPTYSSNAGFLLHDVPGASADRKFDVAPFASGFDPVGFARREDQSKAIEVIDAFRAVDAALAEIYAAAGSPLVPAVHQNIRAFSETGTGSGVYMGLAAEDGKANGMPLDQQLAYYASEIVRATQATGYFGGQYFDKISTTGSYTDIIASVANALLGGSDGSHAGGLNYVPFDGYRATLHKGEQVLTAGQSRSVASEWSSMAREMQGMRAMMAETAAATRRTADILLRVTRDGQSLVTVAA